MEPKEKAKELVEEMVEHQANSGNKIEHRAKVRALIAVDLLLDNVSIWRYKSAVNYWQAVRKEITKVTL